MDNRNFGQIWPNVVSTSVKMVHVFWKVNLTIERWILVVGWIFVVIWPSVNLVKVDQFFYFYFLTSTCLIGGPNVWYRWINFNNVIPSSSESHCNWFEIFLGSNQFCTQIKTKQNTISTTYFFVFFIFFPFLSLFLSESLFLYNFPMKKT